MSIPSLPATLTPALSGRDAIADTIYRATSAFDYRDLALLRSAFLEEAVLEINGRAMEGIQAIIDDCFTPVSNLDTTHHVTGLRINILEEDAKAEATASALAQHFKAGEGMKQNGVPLFAGSLYWMELVKDSGDGLWKVKKWILQSNWGHGDWGVFAS